MEYILRFLCKMPRGRFEYTCGICGNYEVTHIPNDDKEALHKFVCKNCGMIIHIWEQPEHWHITLTNEK